MVAVAVAPRETPNLKRLISLRAAEVARRHIGLGEVGGNNRGPYIRRLLDGKESAWCAGAVWTWHSEAAAELGGWRLPIPRTHGAKKLYRRIGRAGLFLERPVVGAVACWDRGLLFWQGHVEIVVAVEGDVFYTVAPNVGAFPAVVHIRIHRLGEPKLIGFAVLT